MISSAVHDVIILWGMALEGFSFEYITTQHSRVRANTALVSLNLQRVGIRVEEKNVVAAK